MHYLRVVEEQGRYVASLSEAGLPTPARGEVLIRVTASGIPEAFLTAFVNLIVEGGLPREATVLVHAGASGVGLAAIQIAKLSGARVVATTRSADKLKAIEAAGGDLAIDTADRDFVAEIEKCWGRDAVDVVLDPVGASTVAGDL